MRFSRLTAILTGIAAAAALAAIVFMVGSSRSPQGIQVGGPFTLTDGAGTRVSDTSFAGQWRLVYFGYTHCPDACPTTLSNLGAAMDKMPPADRARVKVLFITVDPARDTPAIMGAYVHAFGPEFIGLTGSQADLSSVEAGYHVYARRHDLKGGDYSMDHSSIIYVMRPDGTFAGLLDDTLSPADMVKKLLEDGA